MPELPLVADKIHAHSHRKDHRKLKEIKMGKVPVGVGEVTMLILRSKNSKVFEQKGDLLNFKANIDPMTVLSQVKPG